MKRQPLVQKFSLRLSHDDGVVAAVRTLGSWNKPSHGWNLLHDIQRRVSLQERSVSPQEAQRIWEDRTAHWAFSIVHLFSIEITANSTHIGVEERRQLK